MTRSLAVFAADCAGRLHGADALWREFVIDSRQVQRGDLFGALRGSAQDGHDFVAAAAAAGAAGALVQHRVDSPIPQIEVADVEQAMARAAHAHRSRTHARIVGVAGSNGKTTVKEMIAGILERCGRTLSTRGNLNNHLGVPMTLLRLTDEDRFAVIEMGANRAGEVAALAALAQPQVGVITNAGAEHLEGFGSIEGAARAEGEIVQHLPPDGTAVINGDDEFAHLWRDSTAARVLSFGLDAGNSFRATGVRMEVGEGGFATRFDLHSPLGERELSIQLAGEHNVRNALAASAAAAAAGASLDAIAAGLAGMQAVKGRMQFRRLANGAWLIDDSYNANPSSAQAALQVLSQLPGRRWLVLGDMAELGEAAEDSHVQIGDYARHCGVERLFAFGPLAASAARTFGAGAECHSDAASMARALQSSMDGQVRLLVKGSRVNRLERVVQALAGAA